MRIFGLHILSDKAMRELKSSKILTLTCGGDLTLNGCITADELTLTAKHITLNSNVVCQDLIIQSNVTIEDKAGPEGRGK